MKNNKPKRKITPHKGGRFVRYRGLRVTDEEKQELLDDYSASGFSSFTDYVLWLKRFKDDTLDFKSGLSKQQENVGAGQRAQSFSYEEKRGPTHGTGFKR